MVNVGPGSVLWKGGDLYDRHRSHSFFGCDLEAIVITPSPERIALVTLARNKTDASFTDMTNALKSVPPIDSACHLTKIPIAAFSFGLPSQYSYFAAIRLKCWRSSGVGGFWG